MSEAARTMGIGPNGPVLVLFESRSFSPNPLSGLVDQDATGSGRQDKGVRQGNR